MSLVKGSDTVKKTSLCVSLIPYSVMQADDNYTMYHCGKEAPLILFMNLGSNSNMLSGSVSGGLIYRRKGLLIGHEVLLMIITNQVKGH